MRSVRRSAVVVVVYTSNFVIYRRRYIREDTISRRANLPMKGTRVRGGRRGYENRSNIFDPRAETIFVPKTATNFNTIYYNKRTRKREACLILTSPPDRRRRRSLRV